MSKEQKKGGVKVRTLILTLAQSPCKPNCPGRAWNCHVRGNCEAYDAFVAECAEIRQKRQMEADVNAAVSEAVGRFPGERRV